MKKLLLIHKPKGMTPLQAVQKTKLHFPQYQSLTISYAGRLDPMAEGLLLLLIGDENKKRTVYEALEKEYSFDVLFGISTDTYDTLGRIETIITPPSPETLTEKIQAILPDVLGTLQQTYPPYSSFHVKKKPLFYWAREGKLSDITIPQKKITIHSLTLISVHTVFLKDFIPSIVNDIEKVQGDFRQEEIIKDWQKLLKDNPDLSLPHATFTATCTSGTYVRSLAHSFGKKIGCGAIATRILRTRVGSYLLSEATRLPVITSPEQ